MASVCSVYRLHRMVLSYFLYSQLGKYEYRNIAGITRFFNGLLPPSPSYTNSSVPRNIYLPSHHQKVQNQPNSIPRSGHAITWCWRRCADEGMVLGSDSSEDHPTDVVDSDLPMESLNWAKGRIGPSRRGNFTVECESVQVWYAFLLKRVGRTKCGVFTLSSRVGWCN